MVIFYRSILPVFIRKTHEPNLVLRSPGPIQAGSDCNVGSSGVARRRCLLWNCPRRKRLVGSPVAARRVVSLTNTNCQKNSSKSESMGLKGLSVGIGFIGKMGSRKPTIIKGLWLFHLIYCYSWMVKSR